MERERARERERERDGERKIESCRDRKRDIENLILKNKHASEKSQCQDWT